MRENIFITADEVSRTLEISTSFVALYKQDITPKLKENSWITKENIIAKHLLPYFGNFRMCDITANGRLDTSSPTIGS